LQELVQAFLSSSDLSIVDNCSIVMLYEISHRLRMPIQVMDSRTTRIRLENSNRIYFFTAFSCVNLEAITFVFAAYNKSLLI
jgi:hypothetical protein